MNDTLEIPVAHLERQLQDGFVHDWLVAGPQAIPVDLSRYRGPDFKRQIVRARYSTEMEIDHPPAEQASFELTDGQGGTEKLTWQAIRCRVDHFVDLTGFYHTCHYLRAWAYTQVVTPASRQATLVLTTNGPADVWINGKHVHRQEHFHHQLPHSVRFSARLVEGCNEILVRFEEVAVRECPYAMALQISDIPTDDLTVLLPTTLEPVARRQKLEAIMDAAYLDQDVYHREQKLVVRWPKDLKLADQITVRLQTPSGRIYAEGQPHVRAGFELNLGPVYQVPEGDYQILLMPHPEEYYVHGMRIQRRIPLRIANGVYSQTLYGTPESRRREALEDAARRNLNVFSEIAKMALGRWQQVKTNVILETVERINQRADCSDFYLVGLLGMMIRYMDDPNFPEDLVWPLADCVLNFKYWMDEPGDDAMCYWSENHQILFHTCEILAGQLYPDREFSNVNKPGSWHREKGERLALSWLHKRATGGFREWDSNTYFEEDVLALTHLADLAENDEVAELAAVVLDKLFFTMAVNSFRGVFGSTHGRTYAPFIKGGRLEPTSGLGRILWGLGTFNNHILGTVSLACAQGYELPPLIAAIALDRPEEMWNRERHAGTLEEAVDCATGSWEINKVTYKTPDYMLASAQDYQPGQYGYQQHIWQATLSPDAVVFVTHPPCLSEEGSHRPNAWHGNVVLPRVAQWKDVLIAVHKLPADDWLGFTHAYFPFAAFDDVRMEGGWAFARKDNGYLALTAAQGLQRVENEDSANHELRSYGLTNIWLCQMGRAAQDGSFDEFVAKVLATQPSFDGLNVWYRSLRGETLRFGWEGPLLVDGREQAITGFKHYENPYCVADLPCELMEIRFADQAMRLNFAPPTS